MDKDSSGGGGRYLKLLAVCLPLFGLLVAVGLRWNRERFMTAECRRNFERLAGAAGKYADENGGAYPYGPRATEKLMFAYLRRDEFMRCPKNRVAYRWTRRARRRGDPAHLLLAWEAPSSLHGFPAGRLHALFVGGRVKLMAARDLEALIREEQAEPVTRPPRGRPHPGLTGGPDSPPPGAVPKVPPGTPGPPPPDPRDWMKGPDDARKAPD